MKFEYLPGTINLKKGEPVILELSSLDRTHGFKVPDLGIRTDVLADTTVRVRVVPGKAGRTDALPLFQIGRHESRELEQPIRVPPCQLQAAAQGIGRVLLQADQETPLWGLCLFAAGYCLS